MKSLYVYRCSIEFLAYSVRVVARIPRGFGELRDQLKRAALSLPLNIAEGTGKVRQADKARYYAIARGSAFECAAILDACRVLDLLAVAEVTEGKTCCCGSQRC